MKLESLLYLIRQCLLGICILVLSSCGGLMEELGAEDGLDDSTAEVSEDGGSFWSELTSEDEASAEQEQSIDLVTDLLNKSVTVYLYNEQGELEGLGSGVFVAEDKIATNYHVVDSFPDSIISVVNGSEKKLGCRILKLDKAHDVALLQFDGFRAEPIALASSPPKIGENVIVAGSPEGLTGTISKGNISAFRDFKPYDFKLLQISAPISQGSSGGPVINEKGELLGITVSTFSEGQNLNFAVPVRYVKYLLQTD
jgi:S1-C subfamily serine protease